MADRRPMPDDGRIGKEIDWSLVIPSITRPVWEPPALEVLDLLEEIAGDEDVDFFNFNNEELKREFPDPEVRLGVFDLVCEMDPLGVYME